MPRSTCTSNENWPGRKTKGADKSGFAKGAPFPSVELASPGCVVLTRNRYKPPTTMSNATSPFVSVVAVAFRSPASVIKSTTMPT
jgi:hypothetical protein